MLNELERFKFMMIFLFKMKGSLKGIWDDMKLRVTKKSVCIPLHSNESFITALKVVFSCSTKPLQSLEQIN